MAAAAWAPGWATRPVLLLLLLLLLPPPPLLRAVSASREPRAAARLSLHPPYFNLAEAARIWATATCGEREPGGARPRPELYCKLVGGPTAPGSGHTIQVRSRSERGVAGGGAPSPLCPACSAQRPHAGGGGPSPAYAGEPR